MIRSAISLLLCVGAPACAALDCAACHASITKSFAGTAHANASSIATAESILGSFERHRNLMQTGVPGVYFRMEQRRGRFYQTGFQGHRSQTEPFDVVIGSGRRGQSYLYWRDGLLFQLPVSYHVGTRRWINSPGYEDGKVHFGRAIPPQCLDCHASGFRLERVNSRVRYAGEYAFGIGCGKCHGETTHHEQIVRPSGLDLCARCHSGLPEEPHAQPDVHGNQVGLLKASRCFQRSGTMTCTTCHDVHQVQRDPAALSSRCGICHADRSCPIARAQSESSRSACADCHMPVTRSKLIEVQSYRTHRIAVYR